MPVDSSLYGAFAPRVRSVSDYQNDLDKQDDQHMQMQGNALALQEKRRQIADDAVSRQAFQASNGDPAAYRQKLVEIGRPDLALAHDKAQSTLAKDKSETDAHAAKARLDQIKAYSDGAAYLSQGLAKVNVQDDHSIADWYKDAVQKGLISFAAASKEINAVPPAGPARDKWKADQQMAGLTQQQQAEQLMKQATLAQQAQQFSVTSAMTDRHQRATEGLTARGQNMADERAKETLKKDYKIAGIDPQTGNFVGGDDAGASAMVDLVGKGQMSMSTALARTPPGQKERFAQELQKRYPDFDATALATKTAAAKAFTTGKEGALLRSIGTANKHLDMLDGLVGALDNKDTQLFNKIGNTFATATGKPAPTNFDAAKDIVGQEVVKAIVANGGSMAERTEAAKTISSSNSPAQLRGVIKTYKQIMEAQHESLLQQRDAAGLPRSTLPDYTEAKAPVGALPAGWKIEKVGQ